MQLSVAEINPKLFFAQLACCYFTFCKVKGKVKFTLEQAMKAQRGSRGIAVLFP
jgi:hypothetical protein